MLERLKKFNSKIEIFSIKGEEFKKYGNVLEIETDEIVKACKKLTLPELGSEYIASVDSLETLNMSENLRQIMFGGCEAQIGITHGHNNFMNGLEYHRCSEVNIAATPLVLFLGLQYEMEGNEYDSSKVKAFYMEKGDAVEIYATTLHFCPCQVTDGGFGCVVALPQGTNVPLTEKCQDPLLFRRNKWIICHNENTSLIERGVVAGIYGENYKINY